MHYTTVTPKSGDPINPDEVYVVGHSLGAGWTRHIAEIGDGDTHVNFASTKGPIYGPVFVVTDISPSGISQRLYDDAAGFYKDIGCLPWADRETVHKALDDAAYYRLGEDAADASEIEEDTDRERFVAYRDLASRL